MTAAVCLGRCFSTHVSELSLWVEFFYCLEEGGVFCAKGLADASIPMAGRLKEHAGSQCLSVITPIKTN